jgi:hypothetical protein
MSIGFGHNSGIKAEKPYRFCIAGYWALICPPQWSWDVDKYAYRLNRRLQEAARLETNPDLEHGEVASADHGRTTLCTKLS